MLLSLFYSSPLTAIAWIIAMLAALSIHEFSHAFAAYRLGDYTARDQGRLTLNPIKHIDFLGLAFLLIAGFGWGKPVPVNYNNLRNQKWGPAIVSVAGPLSNIIFAIVVGIILRVLVFTGGLSENNGLFLILSALLILNIIFAVFNLLPIPPLDGSKILFALLSDKYRGLKYFLSRYGIFILLGLVFLGGNILSIVFSAITQFVFSLVLM